MSFMTLFCETLKKRGYRTTHNRFASARTALIPIAMDPDCLANWKSKSSKRKVFQRLDGVFYDPEKSDFDEVRNRQLRSVYHDLADGLIFQSAYSQQQCEYYLGKPESGASSCIICNGTNLNVFHPNLLKSSICNREIRFITTGNFRDREMLLPILNALDHLNEKFELKLEIVGPIAADLQLDFGFRSYVQLAGMCDRLAISQKLQQADIFLFSFLNPNCPNSVIEATACGLPVVGFRSGAMEELCDFNSALLANLNTKNPIIHKRSEIEAGADELSKKIEICIQQYEEFRDNAIRARERFDIERVVEAYLNQILPES